MRISSVQMMGGYLKQLNDEWESQSKLMEQADGSNLHRPSDDSVRYSKYLRHQNTLTENLQYNDNVKRGYSWMDTADKALVNITNLQQTIVEKTVQAANDTNNEMNVNEVAKEIYGYIQQIVALGNDQQGDRYLFGGQSDLIQPFVMSLDESEWVDRGLAKTLDDPQKKFFYDADSNGNATQMLTLEGSDGETYYLNTMTGKVYTHDFMKDGYKALVNKGQERVKDGDEVFDLRDEDSFNVAAFFKNTGEIKTKGTVTVNKGTDATELADQEFGAVVASYEDGVKTAVKADCVMTIHNGTKTKLIAAGEQYILQEGEYAEMGGTLIGHNPNLLTQVTLTETSSAEETDLGKMLLGETVDLETGTSYSLNVPVTVITTTENADGSVTVATSVLAAGTEFQINDNQTVKVGLSKDEELATLNDYKDYVWADEDTEGVPASLTFKFKTINQPIVTYQGDAKYISMVKRNGLIDPTADTVNASGQDIFGSDIFDNVNSGNQVNKASSGTAAINDLLTVYAKMRAADTHWLSSDGITLSDAAHQVTVDAETTVAARQQVYEQVDFMLQNQNAVITQDINDVSAADVAKLAVNLMAAQTIYNMTLSVGGRILPPTLADYL